MRSTMFRFGEGADGRCPECSCRITAVRVPGDHDSLDGLRSLSVAAPCGHLLSPEELDLITGERPPKRV